MANNRRQRASRDRKGMIEWRWVRGGMLRRYINQTNSISSHRAKRRSIKRSSTPWRLLTTDSLPCQSICLFICLRDHSMRSIHFSFYTSENRRQSKWRMRYWVTLRSVRVNIGRVSNGAGGMNLKQFFSTSNHIILNCDRGERSVGVR